SSRSRASRHHSTSSAGAWSSVGHGSAVAVWSQAVIWSASSVALRPWSAVNNILLPPIVRPWLHANMVNMMHATFMGATMAEVSDPGPRPLWTGEVAKLAGVTGMTINRWADAGRIVAAKTLGGNRRYEQSEVRRLLAEMGRPVPGWLRG